MSLKQVENWLWPLVAFTISWSYQSHGRIFGRLRLFVKGRSRWFFTKTRLMGSLVFPLILPTRYTSKNRFFVLWCRCDNFISWKKIGDDPSTTAWWESVFLGMIWFFPCMTFTKGVEKPPGTSWGSWPKRRKWPTEIRWEASRLLAVQSWREKQPKRCTQFFFVQANPCNITSNICIQLPCGVIQQTMVISDKLYIPMVWPGISQTSIGEKHPKSLMIKKSQLGCRNSPWSKISPGWETPTKSRISDDPNQKLGWFSTF